MSFNLFVRQFTVWCDFFPFEASAIDIFLGGERLSGFPTCGCFDSVRVGDDTVVLGTEFVDDCGVFLINEVLFTELELELIRGIGQQS